MKYVIVRQVVRRNLDNKPQFIHSTIVCRHPVWGNLFYGTVHNKNIIYFNTLKEGEDFIQIWLNRTDSHFNFFDGKKINAHVCIKFEDVDIQGKKKSKYLRPKKKTALITTKNRICEEPERKLTKQEINDNIDRLFKTAEKNRKLREQFLKNNSDAVLYNDIDRDIVKIDNQRTTKYNTVRISPNGRTIPQNKNVIVAKILIKDLNTGLYIRVPESGNCELVNRCDCTLFSDSNQSHYIVSNIQARSFMYCYHDMKLIEVYMKNDKPIRKQESDDSHEVENHLCDIDKIFKDAENADQ